MNYRQQRCGLQLSFYFVISRLRRVRSFVVMAFLITSTGVVPAMATGTMKTSVAYQSDSPVTITQCDIQSYSDYDFHIEPNLRFSSNVSKTIVGIRFGLTFYKRSAIDGSQSLGPPITFEWPRNDNATLGPLGVGGYHDAIGQTEYPSSDNVVCSVLAVRYDDGTKWEPGASLAPRQGSAAAQSSVPSTVSTTTSGGDDHLWLGEGTKANPLEDGHPKFCTVSEQVFDWKVAQCHFARIAWAVRAVPGSPSPTLADSSSPSATDDAQQAHSASFETDKALDKKCGISEASLNIRISTIQTNDRNFSGAEESLQKAIAIENGCVALDGWRPSTFAFQYAVLAQVHAYAGRLLTKLSRTAEAKSEFQQASNIASGVLQNPAATDQAKKIATKALQLIEK